MPSTAIVIKTIQPLFDKLNLNISNIQSDVECEEYCGYNFQIGSLNIKFRKGKITPKKIGQFVTLWRRNANGITEPFQIEDDFDFYIILCKKQDKIGFFLFPKSVLAEKQILTNGLNEGKRGFRVYPNWDVPENKQAEKTKLWQTEFFIDLDKKVDAVKLAKLLQK